MSREVFTCEGGEVVLPDARLVLVSREDGGHLIVNPPRPVWERSELNARELMLWSYLVAATGEAMLDVLPALDGGCINYWEAGNWALNNDADPKGPKSPKQHRRVHMHLLGRSPRGRRWGESPAFPDFAHRFAWAAGNVRLTPDEYAAIVGRTSRILKEKYGE